ncbi:hypothetical protein [Pseudomonas sp. PS02290]|uniref:hypothetical protein n=1 Tax=Pseudomonas sp. PS02290 TaxID=2991430 RepID=UPI001A1247FA|nr:hypothetical protein [Pseudomonas sp. PS02290]MBF9243215.1 hypothetical protein [Pseudomonas syringae pv. tomato]MBW8023680.1 hypothetical protein [Pseudomonas syringae pv. tomato]
MSSKTELTDRDHENMDAFLGHVLEAYKSGETTKDRAVGSLAHVMTALEKGNYDEARSWFQQGRKHLAGAH